MKLRHRTNNGLPNGMTSLDESELTALKDKPLAERVERLERHDRVTLRERIRVTGYQRSQLRAVLTTLLLVIVTSYVVYKHLDSNTNAIRRTTHTANTAQTLAQKNTEHALAVTVEVQEGACKRSNQSRVTENRAALTSYNFFISTAKLVKASILASPAINGKQVLTALGFVSELESDAKNLEWRPLTTNCVEAVRNPATKLGAPVRFSEERPPKRALRIEAGPHLNE